MNVEVAAKLEVQDLSLKFADKMVLQRINMRIPQHKITAFIGPSGCGKSSLLRSFNRMNELLDDTQTTGSVLLDGQNIYQSAVEVAELRRRVGIVFQKPNPFPHSVYENVAFGLRLQGIKQARQLDELVESALRKAALWDEVRDRLHDSAVNLSGGQQQRLVIARAIAIEPEVLLLDEPASALDPISTLKIEELMYDLKQHYTLVIVTHNMQQAARVSDYTAFLNMGQLIEFDETNKMFTDPSQRATEDYITGRFG
ncbi:MULTISPECIES: phosphate ABC transporter ATP-binding protein PstB [unclassified Arsukibacterium]|uniref:phosphate ABC transporter ATP-binding protein PstB n=1 Tax=unclassified Arsukibacterium TaxID=2635278 RepID=UPI000C3DFB8C|nr:MULTISPECIES: phosphate ABC transporter ATP-binding protein PstB [unclassified Arsukibacterium]MAA96369.1 phosphate ABC transporter ATP-binding protein [Rheinheimera sp.]MBM33681.1 phosphate ABC transporter ATP-binding protein [Rheinheimera sp.]HAW91405.1 phosphate ABC transporter ATP-binding protein [Candidatus Azambacteria bacterium]|tara:strand:- start:280 stop:1047 length:768 start_codon:yes stop_codon:yes gene_type:complete